MRIEELTIFCLRIPFVEAFRHSSSSRSFADSIVVRVRAEDGTVGYGEGLARPYVTGETVESLVSHIANRLWPAVMRADYGDITPRKDPLTALSSINKSLLEKKGDVIAWHGARTAIELALIDCLLRSQGLSLGKILPAQCSSITYSGVITAGSIEAALRHARYFKLFGIKYLKLKIDGTNPVERVAAIRRAVGSEISLRVDANGAYDAPTAAKILSALQEFGIAAAEQPIKRSSPTELAHLRANSPIPIVVDESLVTIEDARALVNTRACDYFNLRLSKCGGIFRTLQMARLAAGAGLRIQFGSHVGETAILSAAGRHLAAHLEHVDFVEGSYGSLLLAEDVSRDSVVFGHGGVAPLLRGPGLGIQVREEVLHKYARNIISLSSPVTRAFSGKEKCENVSDYQEGHQFARETRASQARTGRHLSRKCSTTLPG